MSAPALAGRRVVVTRPAGQTAHLAALIRAAGGEPLLFPALEIFDAGDLQPVLALIERLDAFDLAIFISANAVEKALALVRARRAWPPALRVATVGRGSERELQRRGFAAVIAPTERFDSEALLDLPELKQMQGKRVVIFRGEGGRELLGDALTARGAAVEYAACYRRGRPKADPAPLLAWCARSELDAFRDFERGPGQSARHAGRGRRAVPEEHASVRAARAHRRRGARPGSAHRGADRSGRRRPGRGDGRFFC